MRLKPGTLATINDSNHKPPDGYYTAMKEVRLARTLADAIENRRGDIYVSGVELHNQIIEIQDYWNGEDDEIYIVYIPKFNAYRQMHCCRFAVIQ